MKDFSIKKVVEQLVAVSSTTWDEVTLSGGEVG